MNEYGPVRPNMAYPLGGSLDLRGGAQYISIILYPNRVRVKPDAEKVLTILKKKKE